MRTIVLAVSVVLSGCMPSISYEPRTMPPPARSEAEACYLRQRIEVGTATATNTYSEGGSYDVTTGTLTQNIVTWHGSGMTLYQGGERLEPREGLSRTGDAELARAYDETLSSTSGASVGYELSRDGSLVLAFGGLALTGVALGQVMSDKNLAEKNMGDFPVLWIGVGAALASIIPALIAWKTHDGAVRHSLDEHLVPSHLTDRTLGAVRAHNKKAMAACRVTETEAEELPLSASARGSVR